MLSARERLVLTHNGHDLVTGGTSAAPCSKRPSVRSPRFRVEADALVVSHPLHAWSLAYRDLRLIRGRGYARFDVKAAHGRAPGECTPHA